MLKFTCNINVIEDVFLHKILKLGLFTKVVTLKKIIIDYILNHEAMVLIVKQKINSKIKFRRALYKNVAKYSNIKASL